MGESVIVEGDRGDSLYQLVRGTVEVIKRMEDGQPKKVAQLGVGAIFGEMSVFSDQPRSASVRTLEESVLLEVEREDIRPVFEGNPRLVEELAQLVGERRAQLTNLSQEVKEAEVNHLIHQMLKIFTNLTGMDSDDPA
jgi:CRP-like cAMP-binding protein